MATASPAISNNSADNTNSITGGATTSSPGGRSITALMSPMSINNNNNNSNFKTLRGQNKPKCIKCGNVARSRCPYTSCKNCCAKAQNPCFIHVLKNSTPVTEKLPSAGSSVTEQRASETPLSGNVHRVTSVRQLSNPFAQFNNLGSRIKKPLTTKEAYQLNEWRFLKLKEYKDRNIEIENEAFDRYLQNISLLEEVFAVSSKLGEPVSTVDVIERNTETIVSNLKLKFAADPIRIEDFRDRMRFIVHNGLRKLKSETSTGNEEPIPGSKSKKARYSSVVELNKKLSNARTDEDLKSCHLLKTQIFNRHEPTSGEQAEDLLDGQLKRKSGCSTLNWFSTCTVDEEALSHIDTQFSSIQEIYQL
uniref:uncharacterized protein LOC122581007 n=1 Tax=Erigeron canadensis TaxID=72917 RepID=UPI001CB9426A|nr:uncharacterized protein LOC122581007 [Erigeron canadensis]